MPELKRRIKELEKDRFSRENEEATVAISYNKLWELLINEAVNWQDLRHLTGIGYDIRIRGLVTIAQPSMVTRPLII